MIFIAGPCQLESSGHAHDMAEAIRILVEKLGVDIIFKASFDKANRTSLRGARGVGLDTALRTFESIKAHTGLTILTDVHEVHQVNPIADVVDIIQIPALLSRQTDLIVAAAASGRLVNIKKGQFMSPRMAVHAIEKAEAAVPAAHGGVWLTERGTTFGYGDLVVDMRTFRIMREKGITTIFDCTHSVQSPGGMGDRSGGHWHDSLPLALAATAAGADGIFVETHNDPPNALSDGPVMTPLKSLPYLIEAVLAVKDATKGRV